MWAVTTPVTTLVIVMEVQINKEMKSRLCLKDKISSLSLSDQVARVVHNQIKLI